jgi:hypothetical protein
VEENGVPQGTGLSPLLLHLSSIIEAASFTSATVHTTTINSTFAFPSGGPHTFHANSSKQRPNLSAWNDRLQLTLNRREPRIETDRPTQAEPIRNASKNAGEGVKSEDKGSALLKRLTLGLTSVGGEGLTTQVTRSKRVSFTPDEPVAE